MVVECLEVLRWLGDKLIEKTEGPSFEKEMVEVENPVEIVEHSCNVVNCSKGCMLVMWVCLLSIKVSKLWVDLDSLLVICKSGAGLKLWNKFE